MEPDPGLLVMVKLTGSTNAGCVLEWPLPEGTPAKQTHSPESATHQPDATRGCPEFSATKGVQAQHRWVPPGNWQHQDCPAHQLGATSGLVPPGVPTGLRATRAAHWCGNTQSLVSLRDSRAGGHSGLSATSSAWC